MRKNELKNGFKLKTIGYKLLSIITMISMVLAFNTHLASAAENESYDYKYIKNSEYGSSGTTAVFELTDEANNKYYAYCVDKDTYIEKDHDYSRVDVEDSDYYSEDSAKQIRAIVRNAYPFQSLEYMQTTFNIPTLTKAEAIDATQFAIWNYANTDQGDFVNASSENIKNLYNQLINLPPAEEITAVADINFLEPVALFNGKNYDVDFAYKVTGKNSDDSAVNGKYSFEEDLTQYGATVEELGVDANGYTHIKVNNLPSETTVSLKVDANQDLGRDVYFYEAEGGRKASQSLIGVHEGNTSISNSIVFTTKATSDIVIKKVDSDNSEKVLTGAEFTIASVDNGYTLVVATDENGIVQIKLPIGQYTITETKAPEGYVTLEEVRTIEVTSDTTEVPVFVFENKIITGSVILTKVDKDDKTKLEGAEFVIKNENGEEVASGKTDESGVLKVTDLPYGKYTYQEVTAPNKYILDSKEYSFEITTNNEEVNITVENEKEQVTPTAPKPTTPSKPASKPSNNKVTTTAKVPNTGDAGMVGITAILLSSIAGLLVNNRKKIAK